MYRFAFVMDQQVGLKNIALNLQHVVQADPTINGTFVPVLYQADGGVLTRLPGVPEGVKGTLRGVREIRNGVGSVAPFDAVLWLTWAAKSVPDLIARAPAFVMMDMTPLQMEEMGSQYGYSSARARFLSGWKKRATDKLHHSARHLFPTNSWAAESLMRDYGIEKDKITVLSQGVDLTLFSPAQPGDKPGDGVVRLLFVGGDFERKGGDLLLRWAKETKVSVPWELHIVTRDDVTPPAPNIHIYHGVSNNSPELIRLYKQSDFFVLPTRADCYSMVSMEAHATALPVVISRLGGIPDIVADDKTGFLITPDDYPTLAARLDTLITDRTLREQMGQAARLRVETQFDCRVTLSRLLAMMKAAVPEKAA